MRLSLLILPILALGAACGARTPIELERTAEGINDGSFCPTRPLDGLSCPATLDGCTFFRTDFDRSCVTAATCRCVDGKTKGCSEIGVCSTGGGDPLDRCAPGLLCGATRFGCVVESCGRSCTCGPDGRWACGPDTCE